MQFGIFSVSDITRNAVTGYTASEAERVQAITICDGKNGVSTTVECGYLFVFIGAEPRTDWLGDTVARDDNGFILTGAAAGADHLLETSVPGIFAAGDVRSGSTKRCATAVGEGAMAVQLVHAHLGANSRGKQSVTTPPVPRG